jgi:hypothetical protein
MTTRKYSSRSQQTTLTSAITAGATTMVVGSGTSLLGGATVTGTERFTVVIDPDTALEEIVDVSGVSTNTLTIVRGIDNAGTGQNHSAGAVVRHMAIGRDYREANLHIEATGSYNDGTAAHDMHGIASGEGDVVGTAKTQTLTNKTLTSPKINENVALTATSTELNILDGVTASAAELNILDGVTATAAELNILDGVTASAAELNILDGATLSVTELNYVDGVTSAIQTQIDAKAPIASPTFTGTVTLPTSTVTSAMISDGTITNVDISASAAISYSKLSLAGTITSADIVNGTIVAADIADGTITAAKLVSDPFARANHTGTQTASTVSDFDTQVRTSRLDQMAAPTGSVSLNSQKITNLATPTSNADASTKAYVDTSIANLISGAPSTLDTLDEIAAALADTANFSDTVVLKSGSTMTGALTLSGAPSSNLHAATKAYVDAIAPNAAADAAAAAASATAAAASYDSFDDRYLGAKSTAPSVDNDGNALVTGALYFNSVTSVMQVWSGSAWGNITSGVTALRWSKTAAGGETTLNGADNNSVTLSYTVGYEQVYLNGVLLSRGGDYTASTGSSITGLTALAAGDIAEVIAFTPLAIANALVTTVVDAKGDLLVGTANDTVGRLAVGTNGQYLVADSAETTGLKFATLPSSVSTLDLTINAKTANYTLVAGDVNKFITVSDAGTLTITVPSGVFTTGQQVNIQRIGAGAVQIRNNGTSVLTSTGATSGAPDLRAQFSACTIICTSSNNFTVIGDIA